MIYKIAQCPEDMVALSFDLQGDTRMMKTASGTIKIEPGSQKAKIIEAELKKHPTALFFRSKAIKADEPNSNGDYFSEEQLIKSYKTFEGVPFFTNHDNQNVENARGKIIFAEWVPEEKSIYTISFVDREAYPHICRSIEEEYITGVSMGAVGGGTKILMADNTEKNIEDVIAGDVVVSHTGLPRIVREIHNEYLGKKMYSFDLETYHKSPLFTNDHPILTIDKEQLQESRKLAMAASQSNKYERRMGRTEDFIGQDGWRSSSYTPNFKHADTICEGDRFLVPSKFKLQNGQGTDSDLYYIMGAYLGDGYLKKDKKGGFESVSFCIGLDEIELADRITKILKKYTNAEVSSTVCPERNGLYINFYDKKLAKKFYDLMGTGSKDKRIKFPIKYRDDAIGLINGYLDTDGCIVDKTNQDTRGNKFGGMQISSANIGLLEDVQQLLISLGCVSRISKSERVPGKNSIVKVNTTEYTLAIGSNSTHPFSSSIKLSNYGVKNAEIKAGKTFITEIGGLKYMVCPVKNIDVVDYDEPVYDLTVEEDESYIADGVAIHNCSVEYSVCNICGNRAEKTEQYCFIPNTPILMSDLSIKEIKDIVVGDEVIDAFGNITKVVKTFVHDVDEEMTILYTKAVDGELVSTHSHPYLTRRRGEWKFMPAEFLDDRETLFTPVPKINYSDDFWKEISLLGFVDSEDNRIKLSKFLGYYIAEGCLAHNKDTKDIGIEITLHSDEKEYLDEIIEISKTIFNKDPYVVDRNNYNHKCKSVRIYNDLLVNIIKASCNGLAKDKLLSKNILSLDKKYIKQILSGYIDGDGHSDDYGTIVITTASRQLASQVFYLLLSLGVGPSINSYFQNGGPKNRDDKSYKIFRIQIASKQLDPIKDCGFKCTRAYKIAQTRCDQNKAQNSFSEEGMMKYSAIDVGTVDYNGPVYNIETETHSYVANNTSVHNCSHIKERKGRTFSGRAKNVVTGEVKDFNKEPVFEYNYGIKFIELSAVVDPACPSCRIQGLIKNDEILSRVANLQNSLYMIKTSAIEKQAGQEEITQLNEVLTTLEGISIKLIQNRKQVEVEFASDLVGILSELQTFVDELVGAGYGNVQPIPGVAEAIPGTPPQLPPAGLPEGAMPVAAETPIPGMPPPAPSPAVGTVSGAPASPLVKSPKLPITAPAKPRAMDSNKIQKIAKTLENFIKNVNNEGEDDMGKRLTVDEKLKQKKVATEVLSNSWQEKHNFFEYINRVPSVQDNVSKLSIKKRDDSFIIVAESKRENEAESVWTYETLSEQEKTMIKNSPKEAASYFLDKFASSLKNKKGEAVMTNNIKEAGAKSVNKAPEVITEAQLDEKGLYHSRAEEKNQITEAQLAEKRSGEKEVITEAQLNEKSNKLNPRTGTEAEVITEAQLDAKDIVSPRSETANQITQAQLEPNRTGTDPDVITEKQLSSVDSPWARSAKRNSAMFKSAGDHMKSVIDVMANTVISTGCTPEEVSQVASSLVASTKDRYELGNAILDVSNTEDVDYSKRLAYWSQKNIKVAGVGTSEIAQTLVKGLQKVASDVTINPETIIDAMDVVSEGKEGSDAISKIVDQKIASAQKETIKASKKGDLRKALADSLIDPAKETRDQERKEIVASLDKEDAKQTRQAERASWNKDVKKADTVIETSFAELGCKSKDEEGFKPTIKSFARGALASQNIKLAAITNVTISGDTISIAVQTDAGEQGVEIPVGEEIAPLDSEVVPEADMAGEGLEANLGGDVDPSTGLPVGFNAQKAASAKKGLKKQAQIGGAGGGIPGTPGAVTAPGAPEQGIPGAAPTDQPIQALTSDEEENEIPDEIPTAGQQQPLGAVCPECGSSDVDITKGEDGNIHGNCNGCGAEYEALVKKEIEFKIIKPTRSVGAEEATGAPEAPEVPALPVAAQTKLDKGSIVRVSSNQAKHGHVCPACGMKQCKASIESEGHTEYKCPACNTDIQKDVVVNVNNPEESYLRVKWDLVPNVEGCSGCKEAAMKFASMLKVQGMIKTASNGTTKFPMANCIERVARKWGGNSVATFGPCKGKPLADCVCGQLEKLGLNKVRHLEKLASAYIQKDPMDECIEDQMKSENKYSRKEASTICNCLKKKFASKDDDNVFLMAFADDIKSGKEKILTAQDLGSINDMFSEDIADEPIVGDEADIDIGAPLDAETPKEEVSKQETVTIEVSQETAQELADAAKVAAEEVKVGDEVSSELPAEIPAEVVSDIKVEDNTGKVLEEEEKNMAIAMQTHKIMRVGEEVIKVAATPTQVKDIEGNVEAKVPRSEQKLGEENKADSLMNKPNKGPDVPRKDAYMGKEKEADSLINKELKLPDVAVDSAFMGTEKGIQSGMPAINNEIKGTVIAKEDKTVKEAKKMKEVETVEKDVDAGVPRGKATMGKEGPGNIDVKENKPDVPRAKATMGKEGPDNIDKPATGPDVPIDNAFMGHEKEVQKDMPGINDKYLKNVQQKKDVQLERIAAARRMKAVETTAKLLATKRITEEAYENVIEALSRFEIDKIVAVADSMYPRVKKQAESQDAKEVYAGPAIIMESKEISSSSPSNELSKKLASSFTIGNRSFDENLTHYGIK